MSEKAVSMATSPLICDVMNDGGFVEIEYRIGAFGSLVEQFVECIPHLWVPLATLNLYDISFTIVITARCQHTCATYEGDDHHPLPDLSHFSLSYSCNGGKDTKKIRNGKFTSHKKHK